MTYEKALSWLESLNEFRIRLGLKRIEHLCNYFGNPQNQFKSIHIGGTKGKGSTVTMLSHILHSAGFKVGSYTSPHIYDFRERIKINQKKIPKPDLAKLVEEVKDSVEAMQKDTEFGLPTHFEVITLLAFLYFARSQVDLAIIEVGLGGLFDATNVINPLVSVITNISLDHLDRLGNTIPEIALNKAGIIKPNGILVTATQDEEVFEIFKGVCEDKKAKIIRVGEDVKWKCHRSDLNGLKFSVEGLKNYYPDLYVPLLGEFQIVNAATAIATLEALNPRGFSVPLEAIKTGLSKTHIPGRVEIIRENPTVIIDGAHNPDSACKLRETIEKLFKYDKLILVLGISYNKPIAELVKEIVPAADYVIITKANNMRGSWPDVILYEVQKYTYETEVVFGVQKATERALELASPSDLVCVTGSFYTIAEVNRQKIASIRVNRAYKSNSRD